MSGNETTLMDLLKQIDFVNKFYTSLKADKSSIILQHEFNRLSVCAKMVQDKGWHCWALFSICNRNVVSRIILTPYGKPQAYNHVGLPYPSHDEISVSRIGWSSVVVTDEPTLFSYTAKVNAIIEKHLELLNVC